MAVFPCMNGVVLVLLAALCTSPQAALLFVALLCTLLLLLLVFRATLQRLHLPFPTEAAILFSFCMGSALCFGIQAFAPTLPSASPVQPLTALLLTACGALATEDVPFDYKLLPAALIIGILRELLSRGTVWGLTVLPFSISPAFENATGGLLVAAIVMWIFRFNRPIYDRTMTRRAVASLAFLMAISSVLGIISTVLPFPYVIVGAVMLVALAGLCLPERYAPKSWLFLIPAALIVTREFPLWWPPIVVALIVAGGVLLLGRLCERFRLTPPLRTFRGVPTALAVAAVLSCISAALPIQR